MPRRLRLGSGGFVYHVLHRAVGRATLFHKDADYAAFEKVLKEAHGFVAMRLLAYCLMPNHSHLVLWPRQDRDLSEYLRWLTVTHSQRCHAHYHTSGTGPLYQGCAYGKASWQRRTAQQLGLRSTMPERSRPRKQRDLADA